MALQRVQKLLAQAGLTSRRKAEEWIALGEVTINGKVAQLGDRAEWGKDFIKVRGKAIQKAEPLVYFKFYKPKGVLSSCTADTEGKATLTDFLKKVAFRVFPVGRLDFSSEGLLLLTNDGDFAESIQKSPTLLRTYAVKVKGHPQLEDLQRLKKPLEGSRRVFRPYGVQWIERLQNKSVIQVTTQGPGLDLKSFFELRGFLVERITRTHIGHIHIHQLGIGQCESLTYGQVKAIFQQPYLAERLLNYSEQHLTPLHKTFQTYPQSS